jgi:hypothetical protein
MPHAVLDIAIPIPKTTMAIHLRHILCFITDLPVCGLIESSFASFQSSIRVAQYPAAGGDCIPIMPYYASRPL